MHQISVSVVYATKEKQWLYETRVSRGCSAQDLVEIADFMTEVPDLSDTDIESLSLGVFSQKVNADYLLEEGDRVEIYRPLTADPKEVRRQLALMGKTIGNKPKKA